MTLGRRSSGFRYIKDVQSLPYLINPYIKSDQVWFCPSEKSEQTDAGMPGYMWSINDAQLIQPDSYENTDNTQPLVNDNYPYKLPSALNGASGLTSWASAGGKSYCAHSGNKNFNFLSFDGHVKLYPWKNALTICK